MTVSVSVLMPVYNGERFLREAVDSILAQTFADFEFLILDDGSTDATPQILAEYSDPRVRIVRSEQNVGHTRMLNLGLDEAQGLYTARMDADDVALPDRFEKQVRYLDEHPHVAVVGGTAELCGPDGPLGVQLQTPCEPAAVRAGMKEGCMLTHPTVMMRTQAVRDAGGYRPIFRSAEDDDLWLRISEAHDLANLADVVLYYRLHDQQVTVRQIRTGVVGNFAARIAAAARRRGDPDPLDQLDALTEPLLYGYGISRREIEERVRRGVLNRLARLCSGGAVELAQDVAQSYALEFPDGALARSMQLEIALGRAKKLLGDRHYPAGAWVLLQTAVRYPHCVLRLADSIRRRLAVRPANGATVSHSAEETNTCCERA